MRTKVIKAFFDKNTGIAYKEGEHFEGDDARIEELSNGGFVAAKVHAKTPVAKQEAKVPASK